MVPISSGERFLAVRLYYLDIMVLSDTLSLNIPQRHFEHELKKNVFVQLEDSKKRVISEDSSSTFQRALSLLDMEPDEVGQLCHCFRDGGLVSLNVATITLMFRQVLTRNAWPLDSKTRQISS